eukprot:m.464370 g.464370  ORF g.464370 m.464370 type:complete len:496 (+) comp23468_c0_seq1:622-2109(+)
MTASSSSSAGASSPSSAPSAPRGAPSFLGSGTKSTSMLSSSAHCGSVAVASSVFSAGAARARAGAQLLSSESATMLATCRSSVCWRTAASTCANGSRYETSCFLVTLPILAESGSGTLAAEPACSNAARTSWRAARSSAVSSVPTSFRTSGHPGCESVPGAAAVPCPKSGSGASRSADLAGPGGSASPLNTRPSTDELSADAGPTRSNPRSTITTLTFCRPAVWARRWLASRLATAVDASPQLQIPPSGCAPSESRRPASPIAAASTSSDVGRIDPLHVGKKHSPGIGVVGPSRMCCTFADAPSHSWASARMRAALHATLACLARASASNSASLCPINSVSWVANPRLAPDSMDRLSRGSVLSTSAPASTATKRFGRGSISVPTAPRTWAPALRTAAAPIEHRTWAAATSSSSNAAPEQHARTAANPSSAARCNASRGMIRGGMCQNEGKFRSCRRLFGGIAPSYDCVPRSISSHRSSLGGKGPAGSNSLLWSSV